MKSFLISSVEKIHLKIFGHEMSGQMRSFLNNLSWSFYGGIISMPITIAVGTLAGRFMGPEQYGNYNLVILISTYLIVLTFLGLDISTIKNIAKAKSKQEKERSFFSSFVYIGAMTIFFSLIGLIFASRISEAFDLNKTIIYFVVFYIFIVSFKLILDILVRALENFKLQAIGRMIEIAALALGFVAVVFFVKRLDFMLFMSIVLFGAALVGTFYFINLKSYFKNFSLVTLKNQLSDGKFFMLSSILGTIFLSSDRLLIARFIGLNDLGVYSAYYTASLGLVTSLSLIFTNVLLPVVAKTDDKNFIYKIDMLFLKSSALIYLSICTVIYVFLNIFGKAYPLKLSYVLLFALAGTLYLFQTIYNILILDATKKRYIQYFVISNIINIINVIYYFIVLRYVAKSIDLVLMGFITNSLLTLILEFVITRKMIKEESRMSIADLMVK